MNKYIIITALGLASGFFGEEIGVRLITLFPTEIVVTENKFMDFLPLIVSFIPFLVVTLILVFGFKNYRSFKKGVIFSLAYYLPFQYKALLGHATDETMNNVDPLSGRLLIICLGVLLLSGVYYFFMRLQAKLKTKAGT